VLFQAGMEKTPQRCKVYNMQLVVHKRS